ncbi:MAG: HAD family hydrolase [Betaproteobacteria bacterium]
MKSKGIALFDLDYTLLGGDATYEWIHFLIRIGVLDRETFEGELERYYDQYAEGTLDIREFLHFDFRPLKSHPRAQLEKWREQYLAEAVAPMILPKSVELVASHAARGHETMVITAANSFISTPIARRFGASHILASDPETRNGEFTGEIEGIPCFHEGKVIRLDAWLKSRGQTLSDFGESYFYGDSQSDVPLMEKVTNPVVVAPDDALAELARTRNWPIISLR